MLAFGASCHSMAIPAGEELPQSIFDLLQQEEVTKVRMALDLEQLTQSKYDTSEYAGLISFTDAEKNQQEWKVDFTQRGKFRRSKCTDIPPLRLNFRKKDLKKAGLAKHDDMKLVTYCMGEEAEAREFLLREYLIYRLYNQLTDASYRVQLLDITFIDINTQESRRQMGFLIEDTAQLRARLSAQKANSKFAIKAEDFHSEHRQMASLFQYMIGNADWNLQQSKNVKHVIKDEKIIPVPYDFDFAAMVRASYARLNSHLGQRSIDERFYLGFEQSSQELAQTRKHFRKNKKQLVQTIKSFKLLDGKTRREMIAYLQSFFAEEAEQMQFGGRNQPSVTK